MNKKMVFVAAAVAAVLALIGGMMLVLAYGFSPPPWLLTAELAIGSALALLVGFTAGVPTLYALRPWLKLRPVKGACLVVAGVIAVYLPPQFIASAVFLALGIKLVWAEACELAEAERQNLPVETVIREQYGRVAAEDPASLPSPASREIARQRSRREATPARQPAPAKAGGGP